MKICFFPLLQPTPFPKFCFQVGPVSCYPSHLRSVWAPCPESSQPISLGSGSDTGGGGEGGESMGQVT